MPRLPQFLLLQAQNVSPLLPLLVRATRSLSSAQNELRWLREHALKASKARGHSPNRYQQLLLRLCQQRMKGVPLQYLLRSQPFGDLDILCRPGVLIPRSVWIFHQEDLANSKVDRRLKHILHIFLRSLEVIVHSTRMLA
jgi:methylase of polypeptide subunit release factors